MQGQGPKAVVLAAGVGSRLEPLTKQLPKPLVPFGNRPVMEHILRLLKKHNIRETVSNVHYLANKVTNYFGDGHSFDMKMSFVKEDVLSGDAGGVRACRAYLTNDTFVVVMGDLITDLDLSYVITQHKEKGAIATIALKQVEDVERFGVALIEQNGYVRGFQEKPARDEAQSNLASTGVYVFEPEIFEHIPETGVVGFGRDVFPKLIAQGLPVLGVEVWGYWSDIGTLAQYKQSSMDALDGLIDLHITGEAIPQGWMNCGSVISDNARIGGPLLMGCNSYVADDVRTKGHVVIGDNCLIESGVELQDTIIWPGTVIGARSLIRNTVVGLNCWVDRGSSVSDTAIVEPVNNRSPERIQSMINAAMTRDKNHRAILSGTAGGSMELRSDTDEMEPNA